MRSAYTGHNGGPGVGVNNAPNWPRYPPEGLGTFSPPRPQKAESGTPRDTVAPSNKVWQKTAHLLGLEIRLGMSGLSLKSEREKKTA